MENELYKMMINNYSFYLRTANKLDPDFIDIFRISEVISIGTGKLKEDIVLDIMKVSERF